MASGAGQPETRPTSAIAVPLRHTNGARRSFYGNESELIVGSPDQLNDYGKLHRPRLLPFDDTQAVSPPRPSLEHRSFSSPHTFLARQGATNAPRTPRVTSGLLRRSGGHTPREHSWTLFGQLMENEGQLRSPGAPRIRKQRSDTAVVHNSDQSSHFPLARSVTGSNLDSSIPSLAANQPTTSENHLPSSSRSESFQDQSTEYDSDDSQTSLNSLPAPLSGNKKSGWFALQRFPTISTLHRNILKCGIAYFLASLFTFSPYLSGFISDITTYGPGARRPSPSGHMVATV